VLKAPTACTRADHFPERLKEKGRANIESPRIAPVPALILAQTSGGEAALDQTV
jgi:hypothetical protein